jgi:hypothetical protein
MDSLKEEGLDLRSKRTTGVDAERNRLSRQKYEDTEANRVALAQSVFGEVYNDSKDNLGLSEDESIQRAALAFRAVDANKEGDISKVVPRFGEAGGAEIEGVPERVTKEDALVFLQPLSDKGVSSQMINLMAESWARGDRQDVRLMRQLVAPGASKEDLERVIKNWEKTTQSQGSSAGSSSGDSEIISVDLG